MSHELPMTVHIYYFIKAMISRHPSVVEGASSFTWSFTVAVPVQLGGKMLRENVAAPSKL